MPDHTIKATEVTYGLAYNDRVLRLPQYWYAVKKKSMRSGGGKTKPNSKRKRSYLTAETTGGELNTPYSSSISRACLKNWNWVCVPETDKYVELRIFTEKKRNRCSQSKLL